MYSETNNPAQHNDLKEPPRFQSLLLYLIRGQLSLALFNLKAASYNGTLFLGALRVAAFVLRSSGAHS